MNQIKKITKDVKNNTLVLTEKDRAVVDALGQAIMTEKYIKKKKIRGRKIYPT